MLTRSMYLLLLFFIACALPYPAMAQKKSKDKKEAAASAAPVDSAKSKKPSLTEKTKGTRKTTGLFTLYQDTVSGSVQLYVQKKQLGKGFIYQSFSMGGPPELFLNQNMLRETWVFKMRKTFDKIEFVKENSNFYYDPANAVSKSANVDVSEAIFFSEKLVAEDANGYLIAADGLFISEKLDPIKPNLPPNIPPGAVLNLGSLNSGKSSYVKLRSFPKNTDVVVSLAYENPVPMKNSLDVADPRYVQVKMQHSFLEVPENDYKPRYDDPRIGYFIEEVDDRTATTVAAYKDVIHRWHLKKKDPTAALSEPVEPIVWWVENTTPVELRQTIVEAGLKWNQSFEKAGFKNAVVMKIMPDTATWDPADVRYNVIRWVSSALGYAIGPSFVNPRTGQILGADITIDYGMMSFTKSEEEIFQGMPSGYVHPGQACAIANGLQMQQGFGATILEASGASVEELGKLRKQFLSFLVLHEMGHTMGLNHNMKSSQMLSPKELSTPEVTQKLGVTGSVMDYPMVNLSVNPNADFYTSRPGPYDDWAIEFGYKPFDDASEKASLAAILNRSHEPQLIFGNDADITFTGRGVDPRVMVWDMSNDMAAYAQDRFELINATVSKLPAKFIQDGKSYQDLRSKFGLLRNQRYSIAGALSHYIGGVYVNRAFPEEKSTIKPMTPVPGDYQRKTMSVLAKYIFAPNAFDQDAKLFPYLQLQRRGFHFGEYTEDPKLQQYVSIAQDVVMSYILHPMTQQRIINTSLYGNSYGVSAVINDLVGAVFDADMAGSVNIYRQNAQKMLVDYLAAVVENTQSQYDHPSVAAAYGALISLQGKLKLAVAGDVQTKAHRKALVYIISKALDKDK